MGMILCVIAVKVELNLLRIGNNYFVDEEHHLLVFYIHHGTVTLPSVEKHYNEGERGVRHPSARNHV